MDNGWEKHAEHVKAELERLSAGQQSMLSKMTDLRVEVATLKTKVALYGSAVGLAAGLLGSVLVRVLS